MKKIIFSLIIILLVFKVSYSQDTTSTKYFPLNVGNSWTYYHWVTFPPNNYFYKFSITGSIVLNGHLYYKTLHTAISGSSYADTIRIDSTTGNLLKYVVNGSCLWLNNELLQDSLAGRLNDS